MFSEQETKKCMINPPIISLTFWMKDSFQRWTSQATTKASPNKVFGTA